MYRKSYRHWQKAVVLCLSFYVMDKSLSSKLTGTRTVFFFFFLLGFFGKFCCIKAFLAFYLGLNLSSNCKTSERQTLYSAPDKKG